MQTGVIVRRNAGAFIPNDYLEKVLAAYPHAWGAATYSKEDGLQLNSGDEGTLEFFQETMKTFADQDIVFYFANSESLSMEDVPPYILLSKKDGDDEVPLIIGFIEGNFPSFKKVDSSHPAEYHLVQDYLIPKFESMSEMADGDIDRLTASIQKPFFKKEILLNSVSRGTITVVAANGVSVTFNQNDLSAEYPWGWVSNNLGYAMGVKEKTEDEKEKPKAVAFPKKSTVRERHVPPSEKIAEAVKPTATAGTTIKNYTVKSMTPPGHLSRKDRKGWYQRLLGYAPPGWEKGIAIDAAYDPAGKLMTIGDIKKLGAEAIKVFGLMKNNPQRGKDTEPDEVTDEVSQTATQTKGVTAEILPIMSPTSREKFKALLSDPAVKKVIAENAEQIGDPAKFKAYEAKFADFATQMGAKSIFDIIPLPFETVYQTCQDNPQVGAVLAWNLMNIVMAQHTKKEASETVEKTEKAVMFPKKKTG